MQKGVREYMANRGDGDTTGPECRIHVIDHFDTRMLPQAKHEKNKFHLSRHVRLMARMGDWRYKDVVWAAFEKDWIRRGEADLARQFREKCIDSNYGWMSGVAPYGLKPHNQAEEVGNRNEVNKALREAADQELKRQEESKNPGKPRLPVPISFGIKSLGEHLQFLSKRAEANLLAGSGFDLTSRQTARDDRAADQWSRDVDTVKVAPLFWASRLTLNNENEIVTDEELQAVLQMHQKILQHAEDPENTEEPALTCKEAELLCTCVLTTPSCCFPCLEYMDKNTCYHVTGVCKLEGMTPPTNAPPRNKDAIQTGKKKTKKRIGNKRKLTGFGRRSAPGECVNFVCVSVVLDVVFGLVFSYTQ